MKEGMLWRAWHVSHTAVMHPCLSAEVSHIQLSSGYATDISRYLSSALETHSRPASSDGSRPHRVCCVHGSQRGSTRWGAHVCLSLFPFHSAAQPSQNCKLPLLPSEPYPSTNSSTPYGSLLPAVIYVWLLTAFLHFCDTSKCLALLHTQSRLRPVLLLVSHHLDL